MPLNDILNRPDVPEDVKNELRILLLVEQKNTTETQMASEVLHSYQVELEMQNEELRCVQAKSDVLQEHYFSLYDLAPVGHCTVDKDWRVLQTNLTACTMLSVSRNEFIGKLFPCFIIPEDRDLHYLLKKEILATGEPSACELRFAKKDGIQLWTRMTVSILQNDGETAYRIVLDDITKYKQSNDKFLVSEIFKKTLIDAVPSPMFFKGADCVYIGCNKAFEEYIGLPREQIIGKTTRDISPGDLAEKYDKADRDLLRDQTSQTYESSVVYADGTRHDVIFNKATFTGADGKVAGIVGVILDITEQKLAESSLRDSEARMRAITDSAQDAIIMMDHSGDISYWNPSAERIFGYTGEEVMGENLHMLLAPSRYHGAHNSAFPMFQKTGEGGAVGKTLDLEAHRKDGKEILIQMSLSSVQINGVWNATAIVRDVTEHKRTELALIEAKNRAEIANNVKDQFLANMSHELRTPLNGVMGFTEIMLMDDKLNEDQREKLETIKKSGWGLVELINDILNITKIDAKKETIAKDPFNLYSILSDIVDLLIPKARTHGLALINNYAHKMPRSYIGDGRKIKQIITNLVANAIKFTHKGQVKISAKPGILKDAAVECIIEVQDTGIGIPDDSIARLGEKFYQVDGSLTRTYDGTGLGLAIAKSLIELLGGVLVVESEVGKGSVFTVKIPLVIDVTKEDSARFLIADTLHGTKILVVDDDFNSGKVCSMFLRTLGCVVEIAEDGNAGLEKFKSNAYDIILMDCKMPIMDGYEATKAIRKLEESTGKHIHIIATTAHVREGEVDKCIMSGMDDYMSKPLNFDILTDKVKRWTRGERT